LFDALIKYAATKRKNFDPNNASPEEIVEEALGVAKPLCKFLQTVSDTEFVERFAARYGSGGPLDYFHELSQTIWEHDKSFAPEGLAEYLASKDDERISEAEDTIKFIENRITEIVVSHFKKRHGKQILELHWYEGNEGQGLRTPTRRRCREAAGIGGLLGLYRQKEDRREELRQGLF